MNRQQIEQFVLRYLQATDCQIIEKARHSVTVRLSPEADRDLTNRTYYWNFVERTGAEPETMTFRFIWDPEQHREEQEKAAADSTTAAQARAAAPQQPDSILARYFGVSVAPSGTGRIINEELTYGSRRLGQIFASVMGKGRFLQLFEETAETPLPGTGTSAFATWLGVNYKVEFTCDMKRSELHSLGISMLTGEIVDDFHRKMLAKKLSPRLPARAHVRETISLATAARQLEHELYQRLKTYDHTWADVAQERLDDELERIRGYYEGLLENAEDETRPAIEEQYSNRRLEIDWQYRPRIEAHVINCGLFHLTDESFRESLTKTANKPQK